MGCIIWRYILYLRWLFGKVKLKLVTKYYHCRHVTAVERGPGANADKLQFLQFGFDISEVRNMQATRAPLAEKMHVSIGLDSSLHPDLWHAMHAVDHSLARLTADLTAPLTTASSRLREEMAATNQRPSGVDHRPVSSTAPHAVASSGSGSSRETPCSRHERCRRTNSVACGHMHAGKPAVIGEQNAGASSETERNRISHRWFVRSQISWPTVTWERAKANDVLYNGKKKLL